MLAAPAARSSPADWVAMGDSFTAGEGLRPYDKGTGDGCHRSSRSYARLAGADVHVACTGAELDDVTSASLHGEPPQIGAITASTRVVTVMIGGNDLDYVGVLETCIVVRRCDRFFGSGRGRPDQLSQRIAALRPRLESAYAAVRAAAPGARVLVVGYPGIVRGRGRCNGFAPIELAWLTLEQRELNAAIRDAALASGAGFVDMSDVLAGHELCSRDPWVNGVTVPVESSLHPNEDGHRAMAERLKAVLGHDRFGRTADGPSSGHAGAVSRPVLADS